MWTESNLSVVPPPYHNPMIKQLNQFFVSPYPDRVAKTLLVRRYDEDRDTLTREEMCAYLQHGLDGLDGLDGLSMEELTEMVEAIDQGCSSTSTATPLVAPGQFPNVRKVEVNSWFRNRHHHTFSLRAVPSLQQLILHCHALPITDWSAAYQLEQLRITDGRLLEHAWLDLTPYRFPALQSVSVHLPDHTPQKFMDWLMNHKPPPASITFYHFQPQRDRLWVNQLRTQSSMCLVSNQDAMLLGRQNHQTDYLLDRVGEEEFEDAVHTLSIDGWEGELQSSWFTQVHSIAMRGTVRIQWVGDEALLLQLLDVSAVSFATSSPPPSLWFVEVVRGCPSRETLSKEWNTWLQTHTGFTNKQ